MDTPTLTIPVSIDIDLSRISDLLVTAFEGGVGYWCRILEEEAPATDPATWRVRAHSEHVYGYADFTLNGGAILLVEDSEGETRELEERWDNREDPDAVDAPPVDQSYIDWLRANDVTVHRLDMAAIERGLKIMAEKYPRHWADFVSETEDVDTADTFVQCCLLGEVTYG